MNEVKFSGAHRCVTCWDQALLSDYDLPNHFLIQNLQTAHGKARIDGHQAPIQCDVLDDPDTPEDESVTSVEAALLGVAARLLVFDQIEIDGIDAAMAGTNLVGMGTEAAEIRYDVLAGAPEAEELPTTPVEILDWMERTAGVNTKVTDSKVRLSK